MTTTAERAQARSDTPSTYPTGVAPDALQSAPTALRAAHRARWGVRGLVGRRTLLGRAPQPDMRQPSRVGAREGRQGSTPPLNLLGSRHGVGALNRARRQTVPLTVWHIRQQHPTTGADYTSALVTGGAR